MDPKKILVIRDGRLGDILMITPVLRALQQQWPEHEIEVLVNAYGARVLQLNPRVTRVHEYDRGRGVLRQIRELRALPGPYEFVLTLESSSYFAPLAKLIPARRRLGFSNALAWLYDEHLEWDPKSHAIHNNLELARLAGVSQECCTPEMELRLPPEDLELADLHLSNEGLAPGARFAFLHPPCGPKDPLRPWPNFYYAELADRLQSELDCRVMINGSPEEAHIVDAVVAQATTPVLTNTDPSLSLMMGLIARSAVFIGGDTGPLRMAGALQRPIVGLFGSTDLQAAGPLGPSERTHLLNADFPCSPCEHGDSPEKAKCLEKGIADCMVALPVDRVLESCQELL